LGQASLRGAVAHVARRSAAFHPAAHLPFTGGDAGVLTPSYQTCTHPAALSLSGFNRKIARVAKGEHLKIT
jgi:hypothetical protein